MCVVCLFASSPNLDERNQRYLTSHTSVENSYYFFYHISKQNYTATEDMILAVLKSSKGQNYQSKYLDLPSQNEQSSSSTERILNGYDFVAVNERMDESLVVLAMLAQIPLTDVVVFFSKIAGGYYGGNGKSCVKLKNKWTTPQD